MTAVQKVIKRVNGMLAKGKAEKHAEQLQFAAYKQFCDDAFVAKMRSMREENEEIDMYAKRG